MTANRFITAELFGVSGHQSAKVVILARFIVAPVSRVRGRPKTVITVRSTACLSATPVLFRANRGSGDEGKSRLLRLG